MTSSEFVLTDPCEAVCAEMAWAWRRGNRAPVEHFLENHPELHESPEHAVRLIYEELCLRQEVGEEVSPEELKRRFPQWVDQLAMLIDFHQLVRSYVEPPRYPEPGEVIGDFQIVAELGRGVQSHVFLATQPSLADRPVVLKMAPPHDDESLWLAQLQHTHIIPLYGVFDFPDRNLRALCQPYLGGATLDRLFSLMGPIPHWRRSGQTLIEALDEAMAGSQVREPAHGRPRSGLAHASYPDAICWIGLCLASALQHAHDRSSIHLDVKPSNVLLAADGQPLLLDFHLAVCPFHAGEVAPARLGGTRDYMSPEQMAAYLAAKERQPVPSDVDGRSDVFALGRLLYVALSGTQSDSPRLPLHRANPRVSVGLSDIIDRAMAKDPAGRYASAAELANDLRRHLAHLPLVGVANRSVAERWRKWRSRQPAALLWLFVLSALGITAATLIAVGLDRVAEARGALVEAQQQIAHGTFTEAAKTLARSQHRLAIVPAFDELKDELTRGLRQARRGEAAAELHRVAERARLLSGADAWTPAELHTLDAQFHAVGDMRPLLLDRDAAPMDQHVEDRIVADMVDLELSRVELADALSRTGDKQSRVDAVGPMPLPTDPGRRAVVLLRAGKLDDAAECLEQAINARPSDFWAHFHAGVCAHRRGKYEDAIYSFSVALALDPEIAEVYFNRAGSHIAVGHRAAGRRDYDRALTLNPTFAAALLNRGVLSYQEGELASALADLQQALAHGAEPASVHFNLALVHDAQGDRAAALAQLDRVLASNPDHQAARALRQSLQIRR